MSGLEDYLDKIITLPDVINKGLRSIRDLDNKYEVTCARLEDLQIEYLNKAKIHKEKKTDSHKDDNKEKLKMIRDLQEECMRFCKSKIDVATQNYDFIDKQIEVLDDHLKKFEDDLKTQSDELAKIQGYGRARSKGAGKFAAKYKAKYLGKLKASEKNMINNAINAGNDILEAANTPIDKNEPRYCYCNGVSYGDMIKCDNPFCEKEWFHFKCIGISESPKGKWYCKDCKPLKSTNIIKFQ